MKTTNIVYGRTPMGQLLYDLAFVSLTDKWIARKHKISVGEVRHLRQRPEIKKLAEKRKKDTAHD